MSPWRFSWDWAFGYFARGARAAMLERRSGRAADLAAIAKLHQEDYEVTLSQDPKGLIDLWSEDAVRFNAAGVPAVGKQAIGAENEAVHSQFPGFKVLSYAAKYGNAQIEDGLACEWGEHTGEYKMSPETPPASFTIKGLHVLRRQSDGAWKFVVIVPSE